MLTNKPTITFGNKEIDSPRELDAIRKLLEAELTNYGYVGLWTVLPQCRTKQRHKFKATSMLQRGANFGLKICVMPGGHETAWELLLLPPPDYEAMDIFHDFNGTKPDTGVVRKDLPSESLGKIDNMDINQLEIGAAYWVNIWVVKSDYLIVQLKPGDGKRAPINGLIPIANWDHGYTKDLTKIGVKPNQRVKALLEDVTQEDERTKLTFSRKAALQYPDNLVLDPAKEINAFKGIITEGTLNLRGFTEDLNNLLWVLRAMEFPIEQKDFTGAMLAVIRDKYPSAKRIFNAGPVVRSLTSKRRGFMEKKGTKWTLTEIGEGEVFGAPKKPDKPIEMAKEAEDLKGFNVPALRECKDKLERLGTVRTRLRDLEAEVTALKKEETDLTIWMNMNEEARSEYKRAEQVIQSLTPLIHLFDPTYISRSSDAEDTSESDEQIAAGGG